MLMHRQAPVAIGALAACAVIASGSVLLREQILSFSSWPNAGDAGRAPEIAIPSGRPSFATGATGGTLASDPARRSRVEEARDALGLGPAGGSFTLPGSRGVGTPGPSAPSTSLSAPSAGGGVQVTNTGRGSSGAPDTDAGDPPLSGYQADIPLPGEAGSAGSGTSPSASSPTPLESSAVVRVAAAQAAEIAPAADLAPVASSADNAPPPVDPDGTTRPPAPSPAPAPAGPSSPTPPDPTPVPADPTPAPAEPTPPAVPAPPVETPAPPVPDTPVPVETPAPDPAPDVPPAPADPAPPADPTPAPDPAPAPPVEDPPQPAAAPLPSAVA
jgi:hypothetical protein